MLARRDGVSLLTGATKRHGPTHWNFDKESLLSNLALHGGAPASAGMRMEPTRHSGIVDGLEAMKAAGLIIRYHLTWERSGGEPKVAVWRACDTPDEDLRRSIADGLAGLVSEAQLSIVPSAERAPG
jgi:hypothetical protein